LVDFGIIGIKTIQRYMIDIVVIIVI